MNLMCFNLNFCFSRSFSHVDSLIAPETTEKEIFSPQDSRGS